MRLSKPALYQNIPVYAEEGSSSSVDAFLVGQSHDIAIGNDHSVLSHLLVLPYSFGLVNIFCIDWEYFSLKLGMYFWVKSFLQLLHYIIRVIRYFEMLFLK